MSPTCDMVTKYHKGSWVAIPKKNTNPLCQRRSAAQNLLDFLVLFALSFHDKKISHQSPPPTNLHPTPNAHTKRPVSSRSSRIAAYPGNIVAYRYGRQRLGEAHLSKKEHGTCRNVCSRKIALGKRILTFWALQRMNFSSARQNQFKVPCYNQRFQAAMWLLLSAS